LDLDHENEKLLKAFHEMLRHEIIPEKELVDNLMDVSENLNHMQKLVEIYAEKGEFEDSGSFSLSEVIDDILEDHPEALEDLQEGKNSVENFVIGQVMQKTSGKADPGEVKEVLHNEHG
ncbi:MAG: hypothetical protein V5A72_01325, partial [Candidatus Nanohaloarchaea archaeon]